MAHILIIAEAGVNHNGDLQLALKLIDAAVEAGADAIKFQTFKASQLVTKSAQKAEYQKKQSSTESQFDMIKKLELSWDDHVVLKKYCDEKKILFLSSPFDLDSIMFLNKLGLETFKIPSGEITNLPYLRLLGSLQKNIIMSTGMAIIQEVEQAVEILITAGTLRRQITLLHCTTEYPTPSEDVNLRAMLTMHEYFKLPTGYSDHTTGIEIPIAAAALGAVIIEKHFTLNKSMEGPDHKASLNPVELKKMILAIRNIENALGDGIKKPSFSEQKNITVARKSIIAKRKIEAGEIFTNNNLTAKRPGSGISPMRWDEVIGKKAKKQFEEDDLIEL